MNIVVSGLNAVIYPSLDGMNYKSNCQFKIDDYVFPQEWGIDDWDRVRMNSIICFTTNEFKLIGRVVDFSFEEEPYITLADACIEGKEKHLVTPEHLDSFGYYFIKDLKQAKVKPLWLFPEDFEFSWETYKAIKDVFGNWHPFRPLSLAEVRKCVWIAYPDEVSWDKFQLVELIERGYFALSLQVKRVHNALRMANEIYSNGWPKVEQEFLALWFNLEDTQWIWALPGSIIADRIGLYGIYLSKDEFEEKTLLLRKLLQPNIEPFYEAFSLYGTNSPA